MSVTKSINEFCGYFERQLTVINLIDVDWEKLSGPAEEDYQVRFYRKALIITGLDALAGVRFSKIKYPQLNRSNKERFIRFIKEYSDWKEGELVSLPFLQDRLTRCGLNKSQLGMHVAEKLNQFDSDSGGHLPASKVDEEIDSLIQIATSQKEEEQILECQHFSILYRYRNHLIHEWREAGASMELDSLRNEPYYHGWVDNPKWHLVYPMQMVTNLFSNSIENLKKYFLMNSIDPYLLVEDLSRF